jgi:hypothetical protein
MKNPRYVVSFQDRRGHTYFYFRRRSFSVVRMPRPDSPEFEPLYQRLIAATTEAEIESIRTELGMKHPHPAIIRDWSKADAIISWATKRVEQRQRQRRRPTSSGKGSDQ